LTFLDFFETRENSENYMKLWNSFEILENLGKLLKLNEIHKFIEFL